MGLFDSIMKSNDRVSMGFDSGKMDEHIMQLPFIFRYIRQPPAKVLEIGCAGSLVPIQLAALRYNVFGMDYADYPFQHNNLRFIKDDFNFHNFGKETYDVIIVNNAVEHFGLQYYKKDEPLDKQADVKAMTKVKEIINHGGQLLFSTKYGISDLITKDGKPFEKIYDDKALDVLLSVFEIKNIEYYMLSNYSSVRQVEKQELIGTRHYEGNGSYGFVCVNAIMP
jgi:SAM-dependent methyltransferase